MSKPIAALVADHHAGGGYVNRGVDDSFYSMSQIQLAVAELGLDWLILLGDSVDRQRNRAQAVVPLKNQLRAISSQGTKIGFIQGNHDADEPPWLAEDGFYWLDQQVISIQEQRWFGIDYRPRDEIQDLLANCVPDEVTGLFMHQTWSDFMGSIAAPQCGFEDVPKSIVRLATGDFHDECVIASYRNKSGLKMLVTNPGPTSMQSINEPEEKFFVLLCDDGRFQKYRLKTRAVLRSDVLHRADDLDKFIATIGAEIEATVAEAAKMGLPDELQKPFLQVTYSHSLPDGLRRVEKVVAGKVHLFPSEIKPDRVTKDFSVNLAAAKGRAFTPEMLLKDEIDREGKEEPIDKEAYPLAEKLLSARTKEEVSKIVSNWRVQQMTE